MNITFNLKPFNDLNTVELYELLKLRSEIFVVEQNCVYLDIDDKDYKAHHLFLLADEKLAGYTRLLPAGTSYAEVSIGRVVVSAKYRGLKLGKILMEQSIKSCHMIFPASPIRIGAQQHLTKFYNSLGFEVASDAYDEDGIMHVEMLKA